MASFRIREGLDIRLAGVPETDLVNAQPADTVCVYPQEFEGIKPRLLVKEGDAVKRGSPLFISKSNEALRFTAPAGGRIKSIVLGERRALLQILIDADPGDAAENFSHVQPGQIIRMSRDEVIANLLNSGLFPLIKQRPFSRIADPAAKPKAIFVNGMNTATFQPDVHVVVKGDEAAFQAGLDALTRLTAGKVHLCLGPAPGHASSAITGARNVEIHTFAGPHPAGNSSVHIHHIDPLKPGETVWVVKAPDVILMGKLFMTGALPATKVLAVGGPGVNENARKHYRIQTGAPLSSLLEGRLADGEQRIISGDALSGVRVESGSHIRFHDHSVTVIPESRQRFFLRWLGLGLNRYSYSRLFLSRWLNSNKVWPLNTNRNGSPRAMVLTGLYDQFLPMNILVDFLVRAVLAHDTEEAVKLGLLETVPEDFAICAYACPSKMDLMGIIRSGLAEVEAETH